MYYLQFFLSLAEAEEEPGPVVNPLNTTLKRSLMLAHHGGYMLLPDGLQTVDDKWCYLKVFSTHVAGTGLSVVTSSARGDRTTRTAGKA